MYTRNMLIKKVIVCCPEMYSCAIFRVTMCHEWHMCHVLITNAPDNDYGTLNKPQPLLSLII